MSINKNTVKKMIAGHFENPAGSRELASCNASHGEALFEKNRLWRLQVIGLERCKKVR